MPLPCSSGRTTFRNLFFALLVASVSFVLPLHAQVTTGTITGVVVGADGSALPGVTIDAAHIPTGTHYTTVTGPNGRFTIPNARVGGPYTVTANLEGFKPNTSDFVQVRLGESSEVPITLQLAAVTEAITVTAQVDPIINPGHTGATSSVSTKQIEQLPTVNRQIQDFARTNPYFSIRASDPSATEMTVAGRNNRYNNIQIDGAVNNDLFGLAATGTPGGQANTPPISIDAIQQLQLVVSPYDVRQGGFTGGGINAVTRSGGNALSGSVYGTKRSQTFVGKDVPQFPRGTGIIEKPITNFDYKQYGGRLGGPIMRDKLFFFVNGERNRQSQPQGVSANGTTATSYSNSTQDAVCGGTPGCSAARLRQDLIDKYKFDPGPLGDLGLLTPSDLAFFRLDFNASPGNALTLRHNYVKGSTDIFSGNAARTGSRFSFPTTEYTQANKTNSTVAQWNAVFSGTSFNEARVGYQTIKDLRDVPVQFPSIEIGGSNQNATLNAGTERFSGANALDQTITEITDDYTWIRGNHTFVFGTHNELFHFKNLFLSESNGYYFYPTLAAFENQDCATGCEYRISYATGSDPRRATAFGAQQYGLYASDQWHLTNDMTLVFGVRADKPRFNDTPSFNQIVQDAIGYNTATHPGEELVVSPRVGFNWNRNGQQVRGGVGVFAGRTPYVWISNAYAGTGVEQVALACRTVDKCSVPQFSPDPNSQPKLGAAGALSVDLVDQSFKFPRLLRTTLGYDRDLIFGIRGTAEVLYSRTLEDVYYENLNNVQNGTSALDGRPTYARRSTKLVDATFLTNTTKGDDTTESLQLIRPFSRGLTVSAGYAHQRARSAFDATSSRAVSNWRFQHSQGDIFTPTIGTSAFEQKNRFNLNVAYTINTGIFGHNFGLYYNAQSGRPYSLIMGGDPNRDTNASNDLLYVPGGADKFILCPSNATAPTSTSPCGSRTALDSNIFQDFIRSAGLDPNKAQILNKYQSYEPWSRHLDFHYGLMLPVKMVNTELTLDMLNLLHYFNKDSGNVYFVSNQNYTNTVTYVGQDSASGKPIYRENSTTLNSAGQRTLGSLTPGRQFSIADLQSRWQLRVGLRVSF
ncbi:MAG TPA: carboxypeptidase regulatory-like domain-containing protein [Thermoanaerobaculia bacterium]|nr:carboxypeptidase regulatory-like domain-containing protein [Thermoanaerobaculia bacterium]